MTLFQSLEAGSSPVSAVSLCQERSKEQRTCAEQFCVHLTLHPMDGASFIAGGCSCASLQTLVPLVCVHLSGWAHILFVILIVCVCGS